MCANPCDFHVFMANRNLHPLRCDVEKCVIYILGMQGLDPEVIISGGFMQIMDLPGWVGGWVGGWGGGVVLNSR